MSSAHTVTGPRADRSAGGPAPAPVASRRPRTSRGLRRNLEIVGFTVPALLVYALFVFVPVGLAMYFSLFAGTRTAPMSNFVGLDNFAEIFTGGRQFGQPFFWDAVRNNFVIAGASLLVQGPIALAVALVLNRKLRFRGAFRLMIFVPYVLSEVITGVIFGFVYQTNGLLDTWLERLGLESLQQLWLGDPGIAFWSLFAVLTWKYIGLAIILFLAGLSGIPEELTEAAALDGANWRETQRYLTIPLLGPTIRIWAFLSLIGSFQLFDMVWILTRGNPTPSGLHTMATYMVQMGLNSNRVGFGSAVAVVLFVITLTVALVYQRLVLRRDLHGSEGR